MKQILSVKMLNDFISIIYKENNKNYVRILKFKDLENFINQ